MSVISENQSIVDNNLSRETREISFTPNDNKEKVLCYCINQDKCKFST